MKYRWSLLVSDERRDVADANNDNDDDDNDNDDDDGTDAAKKWAPVISSGWKFFSSNFFSQNVSANFCPTRIGV